MSRHEPVLTVDVSQQLDLNLETAFRATDFSVERCGSEVAVMHKLRGSNAFLIVFENRRPPKAEPIYQILDEARDSGVPMVLVCHEPLPPEKKRVISYLMKVMEPPIYPYQLFRDVKSFQWREETVYVVRNPGKRAQEYGVALVGPRDLDSDEVDAAREFFTGRGNKFVFFDRAEAAAQIVPQWNRALVFYLVGDDLDKARREVAELREAIGRGGVVPLFPAAQCVPKRTFPFLTAGAVTVLPWPIPDEDLRELYDSLRFLRG